MANQTIALASLSASLQAQFVAAIGAITSGTTTATHPAFGGSNVQSAVAAIMDAVPGFASSVTAALLAQRDDGQVLRS